MKAFRCLVVLVACSVSAVVSSNPSDAPDARTAKLVPSPGSGGMPCLADGKKCADAGTPARACLIGISATKSCAVSGVKAIPATAR